MFDVSFGELLLILIVGLLVFGPEKLPEMVRTTSLWIAKLRRSFAQIRAEIEREVGVDDIKREIHNQSILDSLRDVKNDLQNTQDQLGKLPYEIDDSVRANFRREAEHDQLVTEQAAQQSLANTTQAAPEHVIPDNDFQHNERQHNETQHDDAAPSQSHAPAQRSQNS